VSAADSRRKYRLTRQLPLHVLKHLNYIFLDGSLDEERIQCSAKDAAHQLVSGIEAGIGLVAFGFQRPGESARRAPMKRLPDLESTVWCMPVRGLESNDSEFLVERKPEYSADDSERITHAPPARTHLHNSFYHRCTFREILRVIDELDDLLDRRLDRHSGVDLGRDSASLICLRRE
jgi:hypothetical protein